MNMVKDSVFTRHERTFENYEYTYPVISRRAKGLSIGINLSRIKECNFACVYCQVDRTIKTPQTRKINLEKLKSEILFLLESALSGELFSHPRFAGATKEYQVVKDISFSGDGEPTMSSYFEKAAEMVIGIVEECQSRNIFIKPTVITNGYNLQNPQVSEILKKMDVLGGGPWVKLDAGTEEEYQKVACTNLKYKMILDNIITFSSTTPILMQTILFHWSDGKPSFELEPMIEQLLSLKDKGANIKQIQLYTIARKTPTDDIHAATESTLENYRNVIQKKTNIPVNIYV
ncbi:MAG: 4Fe-4S cluster-binding domain-containing protein [Leptospiraceae bacterium]|nr:4Fe-4S cluster-binding domain-containing protein [Leptospiraceae bacterium]MCP5494061.1 4Fe-4S cluster-binding domain-containing protein [Leptospiraceae bacterium]